MHLLLRIIWRIYCMSISCEYGELSSVCQYWSFCCFSPNTRFFLHTATWNPLNSVCLRLSNSQCRKDVAKMKKNFSGFFQSLVTPVWHQPYSVVMCVVVHLIYRILFLIVGKFSQLFTLSSPPPHALNCEETIWLFRDIICECVVAELKWCHHFLYLYWHVVEKVDIELQARIGY